MKKVLFGGAFDPLHLGHIMAIKKAKSYGDYLVVSVMSDERCRATKGKRRPVIPAKDRVEILRELRDVDEVICLYGDESFPNIKLLDIVNPDVVVMSRGVHPDTELKTSDLIVECERRGINFVRIEHFVTESGLSSSKIVEKLQETRNG